MERETLRKVRLEVAVSILNRYSEVFAQVRERKYRLTKDATVAMVILQGLCEIEPAVKALVNIYSEEIICQ